MKWESSFTHKESSQCSIGAQFTGWRELGMIDVVGDISCEEPIVRAVLEEVPQWHRSMREPVHKNGLQESLQVMDRVTDRRNAKKE